MIWQLSFSANPMFFPVSTYTLKNDYSKLLGRPWMSWAISNLISQMFFLLTKMLFSPALSPTGFQDFDSSFNIQLKLFGWKLSFTHPRDHTLFSSISYVPLALYLIRQLGIHWILLLSCFSNLSSDLHLKSKILFLGFQYVKECLAHYQYSV